VLDFNLNIISEILFRSCQQIVEFIDFQISSVPCRALFEDFVENKLLRFELLLQNFVLVVSLCINSTSGREVYFILSIIVLRILGKYV
jgi:hypothetical protein